MAGASMILRCDRAFGLIRIPAVALGCASLFFLAACAAPTAGPGNSASPSSSTEVTPTPSGSTEPPLPNSYLDYVKKSQARKAIEGLCPTVDTLLSEAESRITTAETILDGYSGRDPYEAQDFVRSANKSDFKNRFSDLETKVTALAEKALKKLSPEAAERTLMVEQFASALLESCDLQNRYTQARTDYGTIASRWSDARDRADSVPWYPKGFDEWNDGLAYRFVQGGPDPCYASCFYWTLEVTSLSGCSDGLYAELNMLQGNRVVDWTNDTLPSLGSEQVGQLQFVSYSSSARDSRGELVTLRCY